ncbi:hypothetical protein U1Q18_028655 [Sarracenia purpurea var. burkii]
MRFCSGNHAAYLGFLAKFGEEGGGACSRINFGAETKSSGFVLIVVEEDRIGNRIGRIWSFIWCVEVVGEGGARKTNQQRRGREPRYGVALVLVS